MPMKFYFATAMALITLCFSTSCSFFSPYEANEEEKFDAYSWNAKKQEFLQDYKLRLTKLGNELRILPSPSRSKIEWHEATSLLHATFSKLQSLTYIGVRDWKLEKNNFIKELNKLNNKYELVRQL